MAAPSDRTADPGAGDYPAPLATGPVDAVVTLPGSKSVTNRALILAALADGPSTLVAPLAARDTELMAAGLRALGVTVDDRAGDHWRVEPRPLRGPAAVDVGNAGTVMRFLPPVAALADGDVAFDGDPRSHERPLGPVVDALRALGAVVDDAGRRALPFVVRGRGGVRGGEVTIDASASSQFVSALLLAAPRFDEGVTVRHVGPPVPSQPHIDMTVEMLRAAGADLDISQDDVWRVSPGVLRGRDVHVEPDLSNAAPFLAAAVVTGGTVRVPGWPAHTTQPGDRLRALFGAMGATVTLDADGLTLTGPTTVGPLDADLHDVGELAPVLAAVAAVASGPSTLRGIAHLRAHETDRLAALARELGALGARVVELDDGLRIEPGPLHGGRFATYDDHRLATAAAVLGLVVPGVVVENIATVAKTMPDFVQRWRTMLDGGPPAGAPAATGRGPAIAGAARRSSVAAPLRVIAIDGPAGSGKSTVGRALARELGLEYLDTGAMYRAVAFAALSRGVDPDDRDRVAGIAHDAVIEVGPRGVFVDGIDATVEIRGPEVTRAVSAVAANPAVREELKARQREWAIARGGGVLEGRDIGTVVFPEAVLKVYLTAGAETRAERRSKEVRELDYETVAADLARRDALDQNRTHDPLTVATDAYVLDTSSLSIDEVVADIVAHLPEDARG